MNMDESCGCAAIKWDQQRSVLAVGLGLARCTSLADLAPLVGVLGVFVAHCVRLTVCLAIVPRHLVVAVGAVRGLLCAPRKHIAVPVTIRSWHAGVQSGALMRHALVSMTSWQVSNRE